MAHVVLGRLCNARARLLRLIVFSLAGAEVGDLCRDLLRLFTDPTCELPSSVPRKSGQRRMSRGERLR